MRSIAIIATALAHLVLAACQTASVPIVPTPVHSTTPAIATAPASTPPTGNLIKIALEKYWNVEDRIARDPDALTDPNLIASVAIDQAGTVLANRAARSKDDGTRIEGTITRRDLRITEPETKSGKTTSTAEYCVDTSALKVFDRTGKEIDRSSKTFPTSVTLTKMPNSNWVVSHTTNTPAPC